MEGEHSLSSFYKIMKKVRVWRERLGREEKEYFAHHWVYEEDVSSLADLLFVHRKRPSWSF